jgi:hypothetical protein
MNEGLTENVDNQYRVFSDLQASRVSGITKGRPMQVNDCLTNFACAPRVLPLKTYQNPEPRHRSIGESRLTIHVLGITIYPACFGQYHFPSRFLCLRLLSSVAATEVHVLIQWNVGGFL